MIHNQKLQYSKTNISHLGKAKEKTMVVRLCRL